MPVKDQKAYAQQHYQDNKELYAANVRKRRKRNREFCRRVRQSKKCQQCGYDDWRALCFHHVNGDEKSDEVNFLVGRGYSIERIQKEMDKCIVLCMNCHTILHSTQEK